MSTEANRRALSDDDSHSLAQDTDSPAPFDRALIALAITRGWKIVRCNGMLAELLGYTAAQLTGRSISVLFADRIEFSHTYHTARTLLATGSQLHDEVRLAHRDGRTLWCEVRSRVLDPAGDGAELVWVVRDVTEERAARSELEATRDNLERRVAERTRDLRRKNAELEAEITERKLAESALRERSERLLYHRNRLMDLAQLDKSDMRKAFERIAEVACATLKLDRVSFWLMLPEGDGIVAELIHWAKAPRPLATPVADVLRAEEHPAYFDAIRCKEIVVASDALTHPATRSLGPSYLEPLGVVSTLDVPVWLEARLIGMLCLEQLGSRRFWKPEDVDFAQGVASMIALSIEASQRKQAEEKLTHLAHFDSLTGLPNRNLLQDRLRQALAVAARGHHKVALMFLDLDRFKTINDSLGHLIGDRILQEVAGRLSSGLRAGDTVARLGGDEFVMVLQGVHSLADAAHVAENLLDVITPPLVVDGRKLHVSASIGIGLYPDDGLDVESLMRAADVAMYHVKDSGRNGYQFFAATMNVAANRRLTIETELRQALKRDELVLHYQPQIAVGSRRVVAIEALVRWNHPQHGLIGPSEFISVAEDSALILAIGNWALSQACAQNKAWQKAGGPHVPICVNLSARQFRDRELIAHVRHVLEETDLQPRFLELEITETTLMQQSESTLSTLAELSEMGIQLAIDDFGIGYSSLSYLKRFPVHKIKIDRSFVRDIPADQEDAAIASAIISLSHSMKLRVVAEGVETQAQLEFLAALGCDDVQGYLLCAPTTADGLKRALTAARPELLHS
jgi:diguanylate cyclase (GGDEF)-like protein/PAS domain S-box-containing protein